MKFDSATLDVLARSPTLKAVFAEVASAEVTRRAALLKELQDIETKHAQAHAKAQRDEAAARDVVVKRATALSEAQDAFWEIYRRGQALNQRYEQARDSLTSELYRSADPRIAAFIESCRTLQQEVRQVIPTSEGQYARHDAILVALGAACERAEVLKLSALTPDEVTDALRHIAAGLSEPLATVDGLRAPDVETGPALAAVH